MASPTFRPRRRRTVGAIAVSDYAGKVEREQNAWLAEVFSALVADVRALE